MLKDSPGLRGWRRLICGWWGFDWGGEEGLLGVGGGEGVEGELAGGLGAEFEEELGAAGGVGVYGVDGDEAGGAVEVGGVGDGEEG